MSTMFDRWLPALTRIPALRNSALGVVGLAFVGTTVAGPAATVQAVPAGGKGVLYQSSERGAPGNRGTDRDTDRRDDDGPDGDRRSHRVLGVEYQAQPNYYYCGPAATRIALSAVGRTPSQDELAGRLGTTEAGTSSALDITRVLNEQLGGQVYRTAEIRESVARPGQVDRLVSDVRRAVDDGRAVVANIKGTAVDVDGGMHSFEGGHYLTVTGYRDGGKVLRIADPADPQRGEYWMTAPDLANWIAERGYSA